jgi:hypothetical protein
MHRRSLGIGGDGMAPGVTLPAGRANASLRELVVMQFWRPDSFCEAGGRSCSVHAAAAAVAGAAARWQLCSAQRACTPPKIMGVRSSPAVPVMCCIIACSS